MSAAAMELTPRERSMVVRFRHEQSIDGLAKRLLKNGRARTHHKIHRNSYHIGERELRPWRAHNTFDPSENNARMTAAETYDRETRPAGRRNGALGHVALEVYRLLLKLRGKRDGRLDPSYAWLAGELNRSYSAVCRAIARLKRHGFLDWIRRTRPVEDPEPGGQYNEQISNAYVLELRGAAAELVRRILRRPTEAQRRAQAEARRAALLEATGTEELVANVSDPVLRKTLERLSVKIEGANPLSPFNEPLGG